MKKGLYFSGFHFSRCLPVIHTSHIRSLILCCLFLASLTRASAQSGSLNEVPFKAKKRGLNYTYTSAKLTTRYSGAGLPYTFSLSGIPPGVTIEKAFMWWTASSNTTDSSFSLTKGAATFLRKAHLLGAGPDKCQGYTYSTSFRADVSDIITANGAYTINITLGAVSVDGFGLMVIYSDSTANYVGSMTINDGLIVVNAFYSSCAHNLDVAVPCSNTTRAEQIFLTGDRHATGTISNGTRSRTIGSGFLSLDTLQISLAAGTDTAKFKTYGEDCFASVAAALYYQYPADTTFGAGIIKHSTPSCLRSNTGKIKLDVSSGSPYDIKWFTSPSQSGDSAINLAPGIYTFRITDTCGNQYSDTVLVDSIGQPGIHAMADTLICAGQQVNLNATGSGGDATYTFTWDNGLGTGASKTVSPAATTIYQVILDDGCALLNDTAYTTIYLYDPLQVTLRDTIICHKDTAYLIAKVSGGKGPYSYLWDRLANGNEQLMVITPVTTTREVIVTDGCLLRDTALGTIYVRKPLKALINPDTIICNGGSVDLRANASGGDSAYIFTWDNSLGHAAVVNVIPAGTTTYSFIVEDGCNRPDTAYTTVQVRPPLQAAIHPDGDTTICAGQPVLLEAIVSGADSVYWTPASTGGPTLLVTPDTTTTYTVTLESFCTTDLQIQVAVYIEAPPLLDFDALPQMVCLGDSVQFLNYSLGGNTYLWRFGDGQTSGQWNPAHLYTQAGTYPVTLIGTSPHGCTDSLTPKYIEVYKIPVARFTASPEAADMLNPSFQFNNQSQYGETYYWDFGDLSGSSQENPQYKYGDTGSYRVTLLALNAAGCLDSTSTWVRVNDFFRIFIPDAFSPNSDLHNDRFEIKGHGIHKFHIEIYNRWGEIVFQSDDINHSWDGRLPHQHNLSQDNAYYYTLDIQDTQHKKYHYRGSIMLVN